MKVEEHFFPSIQIAANELSKMLAGCLNRAISIRGKALIAVSGGRTPKYVFPFLRQENVDWNRVTMTLTDERWVSTDSTESNENLVKSCFLTGPAKATSFVPLYSGAVSLLEGQKSCEHRLAKLDFPFDAVYLGFGPDGHFASLFPGDPTLDVTGTLCASVSSPAVRQQRLTLTVETILNSRKIFILYSGKDKHRVYCRAQTKGLRNEIPLRIILQQDRIPICVIRTP